MIEYVPCVYQNPQKLLLLLRWHRFYRQWVTLYDQELNKKQMKSNKKTNKNKNPEAQGYLLVSVTVLGPGDKFRVRNDLETSETVLLPPNADPKAFLLQTRVGRLEDLPVMDWIGAKCNPYVTVHFAGSNVCFLLSLGLRVHACLRMLLAAQRMRPPTL